jgi:chromosomal replication initiation ATPase DnaA
MAVDMIDRWPDWAASLVILAGPAGSGKSHLAAIWAKKATAWTCPSVKLDMAKLNINSNRNFVIEDIDVANIDETALFHLVNEAHQKGGYGLLTSALWPQSWQIQLPDLASRLRAATLVELKEPDDMLLRQTLIKLFSDRQISVERPVIDYLVVRMERSVATARKIVERLDHEALAKGKPITRPLAAKVLEKLAG